MGVHFEFSLHCGISFVEYSQEWRKCRSQDSGVASKGGRQCPPHHTHTQKKIATIRKRENLEKEEKLGKKGNNEVFLTLSRWDIFC